MSDVREYGEVYTSDILIVGGGVAGLTAAIQIKEKDPRLNVLVIDKGTIGWSGQGTKAGNGIRALRKEPDALIKAMMYQVHAHTEYLNDQEFLMKYLKVQRDNVEIIQKYGVKTSVDADGNVTYFDMVPGMDCAGIEININASLRKYALKVGVRLLSRVNVFELLTSASGRVIGAIGFDMDEGKCKIFQAKEVGLATQGCHFKKIGLEFMGYGTGVGAAYRVGAVMANTEFSTQTDVVFKKTNTPIYGGFNLVYNQKGENVTRKYCGPNPIYEVSTELVMGMQKEIELGNGPLWCDLEHPDEIRAIFGGQGHKLIMRMLDDKMKWEEHVFKKTIRSFGDVGMTPEMTIKMVLQVEPIKVDTDYKTNVEGLWGIGKITGQGCGYFGWTRGDGLGNATTSAIMAAPSMVTYAQTHEMEELDPVQVAALKEKIYAPLHRNSDHKPKEIFDRIERYIFQTDKMIIKTDESIQSCLDEVEEMKKLIPQLTANDPHTLAKCLEAADTVLCLEMVFRAARERKESRGQMYPHYRVEYPNMDNEHGLYWLNLRQGKDGEMEVFKEEIPLWRYPIRPQGYQIPEGHKEEFYVEGNPLAEPFIEAQKAMAAAMQQK